ncbi:tetratricopeptide repeat protein 21B [Engraulis encrasicolus]|uniref:tetratricopeptide repeat protein 21B n=1 Tax=Engraulis encrasicolus TaxID=184585 RepID=UPI002FD67418
MAEDQPICLASIIYYFRDAQYHQATQAAEEHLKSFHNDPVLTLFKALGVLMEGRTQDAMRELQQLKDKSNVSLGVMLGLIFAHKRCETVDREAVSELETELRSSRRTAGEKAVLYAGMTLWLLGHHVRAREYVDRAVKISNSSPQAVIMKGWLLLNAETDQQRAQAVHCFDSGVQDSVNVFGLIGKVEFFMMKQNYTWAMDVVNQIIASFPTFTPALSLKMSIFLARHDWEQTRETCERIFEHDQWNLRAHQMQVILALAKDGDLIKARQHLQSLLSALERQEPLNPRLHTDMLKPISRLCGSSAEILQTLIPFLQRVHSKAPREADTAIELGHMHLLLGKHKEAAACFNTALGADESSLPAMTGLVRCQLLTGEEEEAAHQLEFLAEVQQTLEPSSELSLLRAMLCSKRGGGAERVSPLLKEAVELRLLQLKGCHLGPEYLARLDPNFLLQAVDIHLSYIQTDDPFVDQPVPFGLKHSLMLLELLTKAAPGLLSCSYLMALLRFLIGDSKSAQVYLSQCVERDPRMAKAHLLQGRLHLQAGLYKHCLSCLEAGVSHNFQVRELPGYHLLRACAQRAMGELGESVRSLRLAMGLPGVKRPVRGKESSATAISCSERCSIFLELTHTLRLNGEEHEATKVMQDAIMTFEDTSEETRVLVANVELALAKEQVDTAISMLRGVAPHQPNYAQAKQKMAAIYLERKKNRNLYIACYREICDAQPGSHSTILLGDAYMKIQEPEKAIAVYQEVAEKAPKDSTFAQKIGQAYVKIHLYDKAVSYYEAALAANMQESLCLELVELLMKLKHFDKAKTILENALQIEATSELASMLCNVRYLKALARVEEKMSVSPEETLKKALALQRRVLKRVALEQPECLEREASVASWICCAFARHQPKLDEAIDCYAQALHHTPSDATISLEMAQLYLKHDKLDQCREQCEATIASQPNHLEATMLLGDVLFRQMKCDEAVKVYTDLAQHRAGNFQLMAKFIDLLRRVGKLEDILPFFTACENLHTRIPYAGGFNYCKGLYLWHRNQVTEALRHLNKARRDLEWGERAVELMVQICLNPDKETFASHMLQPRQDGEETGEGRPGSGGREAESVRSEEGVQLGLATAQSLLKECRPRHKAGMERMHLLINILLIHTKEPTHLHTAVTNLSESMGGKTDRECVAELLCLSQAFMLLNQAPRARNQLKRLSKVEWAQDIADELEHGLLLLADMYIASGKYDIATKFAKLCLTRNKSCCKALEYLGYIAETEHSYRDAAEHYAEAWRLSYRANPTIGYRLAFNYLKFKKYTEAIDVCYKVLEEHRDFPQIETAILHRAWQALRP